MVSLARYRDANGERKEVSWDRVFEAGQRIDNAFAAHNLRFFERTDALKKLKYALILRENMLMSGPTGAGKSKLIDSVFKNIAGAEVWSMDLTRFTGDTHLFGNYDARELRETGKLVHMTDDTIATAHFAKLGEFFDASDMALRALLGALNERYVRRGAQIIKMPLMTTVADTNFDPEDMPQRRAQLDAVVDRFLFRTKVKYVTDPANRYAMLDMELGEQPASAPEILFEDIVMLSGVVQAMCLLKDRYVKEAYQELTFEYSAARVKAGRAPLSDRRYVRAAVIMEACAILNGRTEVTFEDLKVARHVLASSEEDEQLLEQARMAAIEKWVERSKRREIDVEAHQLNELVARMTALDPTALTLEEVKRHMADLNALSDELKAFTPRSVEVRSLHIDAIAKLHERRVAGEFAIIEKLMVNAPTFEEGMAREKIAPCMDQVRAIRDELIGMKPGSERAIIRHREALGTIHDLMTKLEMELYGKKL